MQGTLIQFLGQEDPLEKGKAAHSNLLGFPGGSYGKESACNVGGLGSIPGWGRPPGEVKGCPLQEESLGHRSLVGYSPGGHKGLGMTDCFHFKFSFESLRF